ncbi:MAG: hypothetical protein KGL39_47010 [Patescibacteria group bacterium]|nr:hypothetical protein [Patescibacteria group bacterium]
MIDNQLGVPVKGQKGVLIPALHVQWVRVKRLASDKSPHFIGLKLVDIQIADFMVQQFGAFLASGLQDAQNRAPIQPGEAFASADAHSLTKHLNHLAGLLEIHSQIVQRQFFRE